jgi:predicted amidohydrolase YtcJ
MLHDALPPDLIVRARRIHVLGDRPAVQAVLVRCGRVAAIGSFGEVRALAGPGAKVHDLGDAVVTPGLTDAHVHLTTWGLSLRQVELNAAADIPQALAMIAGACPRARTSIPSCRSGRASS